MNKLLSFYSRRKLTSRSRNKRRRRRRRAKIALVPKKANPVQTSMVVNLSGVALSTDESILLSKGLSFCPTPRRLDADRTLDDLEGFFRRLRLKEFFADSDVEDSNEERLFRPTSTWMPPKGKDGALETYVKTVRRDVREDGQERRRTQD